MSLSRYFKNSVLPTVQETLRYLYVKLDSFVEDVNDKTPIIVNHNTTPPTSEELWNRTCRELNPGNDKNLSLLLNNVHVNLKKYQMACLPDPVLAPDADKLIQLTNRINNIVYELLVEVFNNLQPIRGMVAVQPITAPVDQIKRLVTTGDTIQILSEVVEATTKSIVVPYIIMDDETEDQQYASLLLYANAYKITSYINKTILDELRSSATQVTLDTNARSSGALLINEIIKEASNINKRTNRGNGNFVVVNNDDLCLIRSANNHVYRDILYTEKPPLSVEFVGVISDSIKVYLDREATIDDGILVGYKGIAEVDAGYFYSPYQLINNIGFVNDGFNKKTNIVMRSGKLTFDADKYYSVMK